MRTFGRLIVALLLVALAFCLEPTGAWGGPDEHLRVTGQQVIGAREPAGVAIPPAVVNVTETVTVADRTVALPPAVITIHESVGVVDKPGGAPPAPSETPRRAP